MASDNGVEFKLKGGNWNCINGMLNNSPVLNDMLNTKALEIHSKAVNLIRATNSSWAPWVEAQSDVVVADPKPGKPLKMRFVSIPNSGFEMRYNVLKGGLDASGSS